jgi:ACS family hexuronate transporter-like MFS transporter
MNQLKTANAKATNYRWVICAMLFFATTINYLDRQVLSLTWADFIGPEFHWTNWHYGLIGSFFSGFYALAMFFAGKFVDWLDTKKGFLWAIGVWSVGACLHAFCGVATQAWVGIDSAAALAAVQDAKLVATIINVSVIMFIFARIVLALGEAGNFPASIKATAEYFPKKDRAFATSIFNAGAQIGALLAPVSIPVIAKAWGWEASFIIIGALGFVWMGFWVFGYKKPENNPRVNEAELAYILQDAEADAKAAAAEVAKTPTGGVEKPLTYGQAFCQKQTWAFAIGKFLTDGVWWFYLLWAPAYLKSVYGMPSHDPRAMWAIFVLYFISMLSLVGGKLPTVFIKKGMDPYAGRMRSMLIFAFFPLFALLAQPLGDISYWVPIVLIGIAAAAHQAWSANIFSTVGDMFPKSSIATITGIGGAAGGLGSVFLQLISGRLFDYTEKTGMRLFGAEGIESGYMIMFSYCAVAYILGWIIMKTLVPRFKPVKI